jgi:hypothetical protein
MALTWIFGYNIQDGKVPAFEKYLASAKFQSLRDDLLRQTGIRIAKTFLVCEPTPQERDDYSAWDLWELPDYAAIDKFVASKARLRFFAEFVGPFLGPRYKWITAVEADYPD